MLRLPHVAPRFDSGATHGITTDSKDSTSSRMGSKRLDHTFAASPPALPTGEDQVAVEPAWSHIAGMESRPSVSPNVFDYASAQPARGEQPQALPPRLPR